MTIALTTPAEINMWVLLSRRAQLHLQRKGIKTPGIIKWCKANIPDDYGVPTTADKAILMLNEYISDLGGPDDPEMNYQIFKMGHVKRYMVGWKPVEGEVFESLEAVAASDWAADVRNGTALIGLTLEEVSA